MEKLFNVDSEDERQKASRRTISVSLPEDLVNEIDGIIENDYHYATRSHFIELCIRESINKAKNVK